MFKHKGKICQSKDYSQDQVKETYENYLWESSNGSTSSQEKLSNPTKWKDIKSKSKFEFSEGKVKKRQSMLMIQY